ncbi:MAG: energy-coupled thiamine transporter ThiT [Ruminococcaceae bacterium]|nr:energy-coupled thiamine transporter ThiT [Oscillospiraceae bacterium]
MNKKTKTRVMVECSILIAATIILSFIKIYEAPLGGSVTLFSMVPLMIISIRHGLGWGLGSAFIYSIFKLWLGAGNFAYVPTVKGIIVVILLDYIVAYTAIGLAGAFRKIKFTKNEKTNETITVFCGVLLACVVRFISHFVNGAVVWYEITKNGDWNEYVHTVGMWIYSFVYNITYIGPETVMTLVAVPAIVMLLGILKKNTRNAL